MPTSAWGTTDYEVVLGRGLPAPGIGGQFPVAALEIDPSCPARYCYDLVLRLGNPLTGEPSRTLVFQFATSRQIVGQAALDDVVGAFASREGMRSAAFVYRDRLDRLRGPEAPLRLVIAGLVRRE